MDPLHISQFTKEQENPDSEGRVFPFMIDSIKTAAKLRELADELERKGGVALVREIRIVQRAPLDDFTTTELTIELHEAIKK